MFFSSVIKLLQSRLATKLILAVVLLLSIVSILLTSFFITRQKKLLSDELYKRAHALAQNLAYNSRNDLLSKDNSIIQSFADGVQEEPDVENVFLTNLEGCVLAYSDSTIADKTIHLPDKIESNNSEIWTPLSTTFLNRIIVPVEVDVPTVDTKKVLYSSSYDTDYQDMKFVSHDSFYFAAFNPNGDEIIHTLQSRYEGNSAIMSIGLKKRNMRMLVFNGVNGRWSNNGRYLVFTDTGNNQLTVLDTETRAVKTLGVTYAPSCFTPDDKYIITTLTIEYTDTSWKLFKIPREGGEPEQLTFHKGGHFHPDCSPDGKWILYHQDRRALYVYNTDEKKSTRLFPDLQVNHIFGSFSPDGSRLCYIRDVDNGQDIYIADFHGDNTQLSKEKKYGYRLTFDGGSKWLPDWSPDNKWIVYSYAPSRLQSNDIWIVPSQGGDPINIIRSLQTKNKRVGYAVLDVSTENLTRAIAESRRTALIFTLLLTGIGILCAFVLVRNIVRPVEAVAHAAEEFARGNFGQTVLIRRNDEIGVLVDTFDRMMNKLKILIDEKDIRNRELEKAYEELKTLDKSKDDFLSLVSHEIRTPLSSILLHSDMLLQGLGSTPERLNQYSQNIHNDCVRLTRLVNDVLDLSKIEMGRMPFSQETLLVQDVVTEAVSSVRSVLDDKGLNYCEDIPSGNYLIGDRDRIIQVLINILSNAIKFTPRGGNITISFQSDGATGTFIIKDTGKGIKKEHIPKVFDRFSQLEPINHHSEGSGLGMAIVKSIVERHGGKIWIESEPGQGTAVYFTLPMSEQPPDKHHISVYTEQQDMQNSDNISKTTSNTILIADDEAPFRESLSDCFEHNGYSVIQASNGSEALNKVMKYLPALLMLDVMMPDMSGLDVCRKLRENPKTKKIKIIMLSARGQEKEKADGMQAGADRYITKPFNYVELMTVVDELLKKKKGGVG